MTVGPGGTETSVNTLVEKELIVKAKEMTFIALVCQM